MQRAALNDLIKWKDSELRKPLLMRGARQVGKSYLVEYFGKNYFKHFLVINLEEDPDLIEAFTSVKPQEIIDKISLITKQKIIPEKTLLFIDEIQLSSLAIKSLRYFKEQLPKLHVIAAGSLLEFALKGEDFSMPVGRITPLYLKPLSFQEFLLATGNDQLAAYLSRVTLNDGVEPIYHKKLLELLRYYLVIGGMPEAVNQYIQSNNIQDTHQIQSDILLTYRNDFGKYASNNNHKYLQKIFDKSPGMIAKQFKYVDVNPDMLSRDLKPAIKDLCDAGVIHKIFSTTASGVPLNSQINEKKFKLLFIDVGLAQSVSNLSAELLTKESLFLLNRGEITEQFVGQELIAYTKTYQAGKVYYWIRDKKSSQAEVDYVINHGSQIIPIEVKSGSTGRLKSIQVFLKEKNQPLGIRISEHPLSLVNNVLSIPLYMINQLERIIESIKD